MEEVADAPPSPRRPWLAAVACVAIAIGFSLHAWRAASTKSPTFDEPVHALSAWLIVNRGDFRVNPEHPPLWKYLAGLPLVGFPLDVDLAAPAARGPLVMIERQWTWTVDTLFRTRGNDGLALVNRARGAMAMLPAILALVVARWAWAVGGARAAVIAALLLALDPNLLAHGALVTNDVAATLVFALAGLLTWQLGRRFGWRRAAALALVCALGVGVKFTCVLLVPMVGGPLLWWAIDAPAAARPARRGRFVRLAAVGLFAAALAYALLWPMYRFRVAPTASGERFDATYAGQLEAYNATAERARRDGRPVSDAEVKAAVPAFEPPVATRAIRWLEERHLVPQAFSTGLVYARARSLSRPGYLLGERADRGSLAYFPLAIAWKMPLAILGAAAVGIAVAGPRALRASRRDAASRWTLLCLVLPPAIYFAAAVTANLNIGVRHVLPVLPPLYVALGVATSRAIDRWRAALPVVIAGIAALAIEVGSAFPNYLAFFNLASGGSRGGLSKLGDSNLDWGQDLPALAEYYALWRRGNPTAPFYLSYFGSTEPAAYGIDYVNASPGYPFARTAPTLDYVQKGGLLAISATALQGLVDDGASPIMDGLRRAEPLDVLNGSIYIYRISPPGPAPEGPR